MIVKTFDGTPAERLNCVKIKGEYFIKNEQCFRFNDKWYRITNPKVVFNYSTNKYQLGKNNLIEGIVGPNMKTGYFEEDLRRNCVIYNPDENKLALDIRVAEANDYKFIQRSNLFMNKADIKNTGIDPKQKANQWIYSFDRLYNASAYLRRMTDHSKKYFVEDIKFVNDNYKHLTDFSFGLEIETSNGIVPEQLVFENGLIPLRDGSIKGHEYATIPLKGKQGLLKLNKSIEAINKYCDIDNDCSVHVHVGSFNFNKEIILALYRLGQTIEDELASLLFPKYIFNTAMYKSHKKDYCNKLVKFPFSGDIDTDFRVLYENILSGGEFNGSLTNPHPKDRDGGHKWQVDNRYKWLNILNLCFGETNTIEFRIHNATLNKAKINNWLFIVNAFMKYAIINSKKLTASKCKVSIHEIIGSIYPEEIKNALFQYIEERKSYKMRDQTKDDYFGELDVKEDKRREYINLLPITKL